MTHKAQVCSSSSPDHMQKMSSLKIFSVHYISAKKYTDTPNEVKLSTVECNCNLDAWLIGEGHISLAQSLINQRNKEDRSSVIHWAAEEGIISM